MIKKEFCLKDIAELLETNVPMSHYNTFGVLVEISKPIRRAKGEKFKTVLRVIDSSFNYKMSIENKNINLTKFV